MRKMIVRIDDVGFTDVCNIGTFRTIEEGVATSADIMLESPGTVDALQRLKNFPWISIGWHTHMWGAPVLDVREVPSLVEKQGDFAGRFRTDLTKAPDVVYEEAIAELRAQLKRCLDILGKVPDTTGGSPQSNSPWSRAMDDVIAEYGMAANFAVKKSMTDAAVADRIEQAQKAGEEWALLYRVDRNGKDQMPHEKWAGRNIVIADPGPAYIDLYTNSIADVEEKYDPVLYYTEDRGGLFKLPEDSIFEQSWHPGYVDYYVYRLGERTNRPRARQFVVGRTQDVSALCSPRLKNWVRENSIELVNFRDALYGTKEYQNHLKSMGSDLYMGINKI
jgi:predicted glycoside hydrolase/deacetylase ChbG (UPF0249 family)